MRGIAATAGTWSDMLKQNGDLLLMERLAIVPCAKLANPALHMARADSTCNYDNMCGIAETAGAWSELRACAGATAPPIAAPRPVRP